MGIVKNTSSPHFSVFVRVNTACGPLHTLFRRWVVFVFGIIILDPSRTLLMFALSRCTCMVSAGLAELRKVCSRALNFIALHSHAYFGVVVCERRTALVRASKELVGSVQTETTAPSHLKK